MTIEHKIWNFPNRAVESQLFHVPGEYFNGGLTSGGAKIMSPEPGGFSMLELTPSRQVNEWNSPVSSWLMSKINGEIPLSFFVYGCDDLIILKSLLV